MKQKKSSIKLKKQKKLLTEKLVYKSGENTDDFRKFQTIFFGKDIYDGKITLEEADKS